MGPLWPIHLLTLHPSVVCHTDKRGFFCTRKIHLGIQWKTEIQGNNLASKFFFKFQLFICDWQFYNKYEQDWRASSHLSVLVCSLPTKLQVGCANIWSISYTARASVIKEPASVVQRTHSLTTLSSRLWESKLSNNSCKHQFYAHSNKQRRPVSRAQCDLIYIRLLYFQIWQFKPIFQIMGQTCRGNHAQST